MIRYGLYAKNLSSYVFFLSPPLIIRFGVILYSGFFTLPIRDRDSFSSKFLLHFYGFLPFCIFAPLFGLFRPFFAVLAAGQYCVLKIRSRAIWSPCFILEVGASADCFIFSLQKSNISLMHEKNYR